MKGQYRSRFTVSKVQHCIFMIAQVAMLRIELQTVNGGRLCMYKSTSTVLISSKANVCLLLWQHRFSAMSKLFHFFFTPALRVYSMMNCGISVFSLWIIYVNWNDVVTFVSSFDKLPARLDLNLSVEKQDVVLFCGFHTWMALNDPSSTKCTNAKTLIIVSAKPQTHWIA
jgi:hypothetical protein